MKVSVWAVKVTGASPPVLQYFRVFESQEEAESYANEERLADGCSAEVQENELDIPVEFVATFAGICRLSELERRKQAVAAAEEAVRMHRQLVQRLPDAFFPKLAESLDNLASRLSELATEEEAAELGVKLALQAKPKV